MAMITSAKHSRWPSDVLISDPDSAGLAVACVVRFKVFTLDDRLVAGLVGRLSSEDWDAVQGRLDGILPRSAA
jgi:mRNA interferase MazF